MCIKINTGGAAHHLAFKYIYLHESNTVNKNKETAYMCVGKLKLNHHEPTAPSHSPTCVWVPSNELLHP